MTKIILLCAFLLLQLEAAGLYMCSFKYLNGFSERVKIGISLSGNMTMEMLQGSYAKHSFNYKSSKDKYDVYEGKLGEIYFDTTTSNMIMNPNGYSNEIICD